MSPSTKLKGFSQIVPQKVSVVEGDLYENPPHISRSSFLYNSNLEMKHVWIRNSFENSAYV